MDDDISQNPTVGELIELVEELRAENEKLRAENEKLRERVQDLEWQLAKDSGNSHRPPSTDRPGQESEEDEQNSKQHTAALSETEGKVGSRRKLADEQDVNEFIEVKPEECKGCGAALEGEDPAPWRHQRWDVEISRKIREFRMHRLECPCCGKTTRASLPEGVTRSPFGPSVVGWVGLLTGLMDVTKRKVKRIVEEAFKIPIGLGTVCRLETRVSRALSRPIEKLEEAIRADRAVWVDETSWPEGSERSWLWVAVNDSMARYRIERHRSREALDKLIPAEYDGHVTSDRYSAYNGRAAEGRQHCWAHLFRDFEGLRQRDGPSAGWAIRIQHVFGEVLHLWHQFKADEITREELKREVQTRHRPVVKSLLEGAANDEELPGIFKKLRKTEAALWQFIFQEGLEPTNNTAERAIRAAVVKRKISYGTESKAGSRFIERILSVGETLRRQGRQTVDYLIKAVKCHMAGQPAPSLLPS